MHMRNCKRDICVLIFVILLIFNFGVLDFFSGEPDYPVAIQSGTWTNTPAGYLSASASDMGKYLQMYLNGGDGIVSEGSINTMFYNGVSSADGTYDYGMGWQYTTEVFSKPMLWHAGLVENYPICI